MNQTEPSRSFQDVQLFRAETLAEARGLKQLERIARGRLDELNQQLTPQDNA